jgi:hypothetical protein
MALYNLQNKSWEKTLSKSMPPHFLKYSRNTAYHPKTQEVGPLQLQTVRTLSNTDIFSYTDEKFSIPRLQHIL